LGLGELGEGFLPEGGFTSLAPEKPLIPFDQPRQRLIGGKLGAFIGGCHCAIIQQANVDIRANL
jgi:hypothetical protein